MAKVSETPSKTPGEPRTFTEGPANRHRKQSFGTVMVVEVALVVVSVVDVALVIVSVVDVALVIVSVVVDVDAVVELVVTLVTVVVVHSSITA